MESWFQLCRHFLYCLDENHYIWKLPFTTHCNLLHGINDTIPIDVMLERRCIKLICTLLHSPNIIVKYVLWFPNRTRYSTVVGEHLFRTLWYDLSPTSYKML